MLVKKELQCRVMKQYWIQKQHIEAITIEISNIIIIGVYCRDGSHRDGIAALMNLVKWIKEDNDNICIIGDLNAKAGMVYEVCGGRNAAGVELDKHLEQGVVYCINDETHIPSSEAIVRALFGFVPRHRAFAWQNQEFQCTELV